jgi:hypothetical protein
MPSGGSVPEKGNRRAVTHGAYARLAPERLHEKAREVYEAIAADAPVRETDGGLPAADAIAVRLVADTLCRLENVREWIEQNGVFDERRKNEGYRKNRRKPGQYRRSADPMRAVVMEDRLQRRLMDQLDSLGMTPRSRAKLGLDQARQFDLAREWEKQERARRGAAIEGTATDE